MPNRALSRLLTSDRIPRPVTSGGRDAVIRYRHVGLTRHDVMFASFPKSGSSWLRFVLTSALTDADVDFDSVRQLSPPIGEHRGTYGILPVGGRLVKTHYLPRFLAPGPGPRVLYLIRDGRDVGVSYFHHLRRRGLYEGELADFLPEFTAGRIGPWGPWQDHVAAWREHLDRHPGRGAVLRYEDMLATPVESLLRASAELGLDLDEDRVVHALAANTPASMRSKESSSVWLAEHTRTESISFVRSGTAGGWREAYDPSVADRFVQIAGRELQVNGYDVTRTDDALQT